MLRVEGCTWSGSLANIHQNCIDLPTTGDLANKEEVGGRIQEAIFEESDGPLCAHKSERSLT